MSPAEVYRGDYFSKKNLLRTNALHRELRDLGPLVHLKKHKIFAIPRYDDVRDALRSDEELVNSKGVGANKFFNTRPADAVLLSDGDTHRRRRAVLNESLGRPQVKHLVELVEASADQLVVDLLTRGEFCGVADLASHLPVQVVSDLVGLPEDGREQMLPWAAATFQLIGPMNGRAIRSMPKIKRLLHWVQNVDHARMTPDGWAYRVHQAMLDGRLNQAESSSMLLDYIAPSLDTTILAASHMFWELARSPEKYAAVRADPELVPSVVNEAVRISSPIRGFTRVADVDYDVDGVTLPAGSRVMILWSSANHDERHYRDPEEFRVDRNPRDHLGWGFGAHFCAGAHLARLEMEQLLYALTRHVERIELVGRPTPIVNNILQGFATLPARVA